MQGNTKVIEQLNARLADELTAINQYMVHAEMCDNWGYERLHGEIQKRAIVEMRHAEKLITRILFLEGNPVVSVLNKISVGPDVEKMHKNDWKAEESRDQRVQRQHSGHEGSRRQRDARNPGIDSAGGRGPHRLDRSPAKPDRANGHPELPRRADWLIGDRQAVAAAKLVCSVPVRAYRKKRLTASLQTETSRVTARRRPIPARSSPFRGRIDPVQFPLRDGLLDPADEAAAVVVLAGVAQPVERQRSGGADDVPKRVALDRVDLATCMLPKRFHKVPEQSIRNAALQGRGWNPVF